MRNQIKYSQIYSEVLKGLGEDMSSSICYVPKKVVVRMWEKLEGFDSSKLQIVYDL